MLAYDMVLGEILNTKFRHLNASYPHPVHPSGFGNHSGFPGFGNNSRFGDNSSCAGMGGGRRL